MISLTSKDRRAQEYSSPKNTLNIHSASKSTVGVKFLEDIEDNHKKNQRMMNVYLQTPYKVLTIDEIKMKYKETNHCEDGAAKLFRAENNLHLHTVLRTNYGNSSFKQQPGLVEEATSLLMNEAMSLTSKKGGFQK